LGVAMTRQPDEPLTLNEAARTIFRGAITARVLRRAVDKGDLKAFKVGRTIFTTAADIANMRESCPVEPSPRASISIPTGAPGLSETDRVLSARAALKARYEKPRQSFTNISGPSTDQKPRATR
jgi:hypothetical protein